MKELSLGSIDTMFHMTGLNRGKLYRNYYFTFKGDECFDQLNEMGLVEYHEQENAAGGGCYVLNKKGLDIAKKTARQLNVKFKIID